MILKKKESYSDWLIRKTNEEKLKPFFSFLFNEIPKNTGKFISNNVREEVQWYIWALEKPDFYLEENNFDKSWIFISGVLQYCLSIKKSFISLIENMEVFHNLAYDSFVSVIKENSGYDKMNSLEKGEFETVFYPQGDFTYSASIASRIKVIISEINKSKRGTKSANFKKYDLENNTNILEIKNAHKHLVEINSFRNTIMHSETRIYHLVNSEWIIKRAKIDSKSTEFAWKVKNEESSIKNIEISKNYILNNAIDEESKNDLRLSLKDILKWVEEETQKNYSKSVSDKIVKDVNYIIKIINEELKLFKEKGE